MGEREGLLIADIRPIFPLGNIEYVASGRAWKAEFPCYLDAVFAISPEISYLLYVALCKYIISLVLRLLIPWRPPSIFRRVMPVHINTIYC